MTRNGEVFRARYPRSGLTCIAFFCEKETVGRQAVRQAIARCFDKKAFTADYCGAAGEAVSGFWGLGEWSYRLASGAIDKGMTRIVSLNRIQAYPLNTNRAVQLLEEDGWTLNSRGEPFEPETDDVRYRMEEDGELLALEVTLLCPEGNQAAELFAEHLGSNLLKAGALLHVQETEMPVLLSQYYGQAERTADMVYLGINFGPLFEPVSFFQDAQEHTGWNWTQCQDEELYQLAKAVNSTRTGDLTNYARRWTSFQARFAEALPMLPVYSNEYSDFYTTRLRNYVPANYLSWSQAIIHARLR